MCQPEMELAGESISNNSNAPVKESGVPKNVVSPGAVAGSQPGGDQRKYAL